MPPASLITKTDWAMLAALLLITLAWDMGGLDLLWAHDYGTAQGFVLKNAPVLQFWFHDVAQNIGRGLFIMGIILIGLPVGGFRRMRRADRAHMVLSTLLASLLIIVMKRFSSTSCPWSLTAFGGVAPYVGHWQWGVADGGGGHCFPGGHSSTGFSFIAASFWLRRAMPSWSVAMWWLATITGLLLGWVQQIRGAHFLSHTLWAWLLCAAVGLGYFYAVQRARLRRTP
jgi:membrane-associated PAP2 superfamily phosphatase